MQLKAYQQQALEQLDRWLDALKQARLNVEQASKASDNPGMKRVLEKLKNCPREAWEELKEQGALPGIVQNGDITIPDHISRTATSGEPIPHACLKVPTGGGKTLLGVAALERIKQGDAGFVLWIVPTKAIFEQTIRAFKNREHPYRQRLEHLSGGKIKLLQKTSRFTMQDIKSYLCIMMLMLPSANRQKNKDLLKIFRDSGGYTSFFPEQDDANANSKLLKKHPDLEKNNSGSSVRQSLFNALKLIRPTVILDEAHKAYGRNDATNKQFVESVNRLNPRIVLELSATPKIGISNILVNVSGIDLRNEEMIKLPIEIHSLNNSDWKHTLAETQKKLNQLATEAGKLKKAENRYVRPIALVRVQRTGKDQRQLRYIHAEDAREYLIQNLAVPENQIKVQSSDKRELAGEDLLSEMSLVRWIITKDALKEGWDCSFAYVLALLDNTSAKTAITQMVGRVMRQPHARTIAKSDALNCCYIYCYNEDVGVAVEGVKAGLEAEGLTGLGNSVHGYGEENAPEKITIKRRSKYPMKIFLPQVRHKEGHRWRELDYDRDILGCIDWTKISGGDAVKLDDRDTVSEITKTVDIQGEGVVSEINVETVEHITLDYFVRRITEAVPNPWQAARIAQLFIASHNGEKHSDSKLLTNRIHLSEVLRSRVKDDINKNAESVFCDKVRQNEIRFHLETNERLDYALGQSFEAVVPSQEKSLQGKHGKPIQQSLFWPVYESDFNKLELEFALYLENSEAVHWWHKVAARKGYFLQGWLRHRIYPDFIVRKKDDGNLLILETKGIHLKGNEDTVYKKKLLSILEEAYKNSSAVGTMKVKSPQAKYRIMPQTGWRNDMIDLLSS